MVRRFVAFPLVLAAMIPLSGCVAEPQDTYASIDHLHEAFVAAGGECATWSEGETEGVWAAYGNCTRSTGEQVALLSIYVSEDDVRESVEGVKSRSLGETQLLVGENWVIQGLEMEPFNEKLGGTLVTVHAK